jgi:hypothetical protein
MQEIVPLMAGVAIAFLTQRFGAGPRSKAIALLGLQRGDRRGRQLRQW